MAAIADFRRPRGRRRPSQDAFGQRRAEAAKLRSVGDPRRERAQQGLHRAARRASPRASYQGGISGFAKTAPAKGQRYNAHTGEAQQYAQRLVRPSTTRCWRSVGASDKKLYSYVHTMNGFAAKLTRSQAAKLKKSKSVLQRLGRPAASRLDTNNTPSYLGITNRGPRPAHRARPDGRGRDHRRHRHRRRPGAPEPRGRGLRRPPDGWAGICQAGERWSTTTATTS